MSVAEISVPNFRRDRGKHLWFHGSATVDQWLQRALHHGEEWGKNWLRISSGWNGERLPFHTVFFFQCMYVYIYIYVCVCVVPPHCTYRTIYIFICGIYLVHFIYEFQGTFHHAVVRKLSKFPNTVAWTETMEITNKLLLIISWYINPKSGS